MKPIRLLKQHSKSTGVFFLGVFGGFLLFAFAYVVVTDPGDNLTLVESEVRSGANGERFLTGTLRNDTDGAYAFVQADLSLVDEEGSVVRDTFVTARHLDAGETWRFDIPIRANEATRAVLDGQCGRRYAVHDEIPPPFPLIIQTTLTSQGEIPPHAHIALLNSPCSQKHQIVLKQLRQLCRTFTSYADSQAGGRKDEPRLKPLEHRCAIQPSS